MNENQDPNAGRERIKIAAVMVGLLTMGALSGPNAAAQETCVTASACDVEQCATNVASGRMGDTCPNSEGLPVDNLPRIVVETPALYEVEPFAVIKPPACTGTGVTTEVKASGSAWGVNLVVYWYVSGSVEASVDIKWSVQCDTELEYWAVGNGGAARLVSATVDTEAGHAAAGPCHYMAEGYCQTEHAFIPVGSTSFSGTTKGGDLLPQDVYACAQETSIVTGANRNLYYPADRIEATLTAVCGLPSGIRWVIDGVEVPGSGGPDNSRTVIL